MSVAEKGSVHGPLATVPGQDAIVPGQVATVHGQDATVLNVPVRSVTVGTVVPEDCVGARVVVVLPPPRMLLSHLFI